MYINSHAHIFNARAIFNKYTLEVLLNRVRAARLPEFIKDALVKQLTKAINKTGEVIDADTFYKELVEKIQKSNEFKKLLKELTPSEKSKLKIVGTEELAGALTEELIDMLARVSDHVLGNTGEKDVRKQTAADFFEFLSIAFMPSIRKVADRVMGQLPGKNDALIALTLDVTKDGKDNGQYESQIKETADVVLAYPGRILPFVSVNTNRPDHYRIMERALTGSGFVGVKLYPSMNVDFDEDAIRQVCAYCEADNIPIIMHCNKGGFNFNDATVRHCSPTFWEGILNDHPKLKLCFAHFGGDRFMSGLPEMEGVEDPDPWTPVILRLMKRFPNVYADISYHTTPMDGVITTKDVNGDEWEHFVEQNYFTQLKEYLSHSVYSKRILWGTDFFLVRQRLRENNHWAYFRKMLSESEFDQIATINPQRFINLPADNNDIKDSDYQLPWNLENYAVFIAQNNMKVEEKRLPTWLKYMVDRKFGNTITFHGSPLGVDWDMNNKAHSTTYAALLNRPEFLGKPEFNIAGIYKLGELQYARRINNTQSARIRRQILTGLAMYLINAFRKDFNPTVRSGKPLKNPEISKELIGILDEQSKTVANLGALLNTLFVVKPS